MSNIKILFIHPNASEVIYQKLSGKHSAIEPPIWAAMLANHCRTKGISVQILDCEAEGFNTEQSAQLISEINPDIACFVVYGQQPSASSQNMEGAVATSNCLKNLTLSIKTVFVGGHISGLPRETLQKESSIDMICQNEGVYTLSNLCLVENLNDESFLKKIKGLGWRNSEGEVILNAPEAIVSRNSLESDLPGMAWDLLPDIKKYRTSGWHSWANNTVKSPFASIYTSLGCPYTCSFCMINIINRTDQGADIAAAHSNVFRWWNPEFIIKQLDLIANMGVKNLKFADELFVLNPRHFIKICELIIKRGYDFNIWAYSRIDTCKPQYLEILKKAGVNWLALGIENPDQTLRQEVHKGSFKNVKILDIIKSIRSFDINISANFIFGLPIDTAESMRNTLDFAIDVNPEMANFYCAMAYPGSPLHLEAKKNNWKLPDRYAGYSQHSYHTHPLENNSLSAQDILRFRDDAWIEFHSNEKYLQLLKNKFGPEARLNVEDSLEIKLKRKLLEQ
jgi:anaerobic magnesium-protoporphyrin IX monomethyl ester cyclase